MYTVNKTTGVNTEVCSAQPALNNIISWHWKDLCHEAYREHRTLGPHTAHLTSTHSNWSQGTNRKTTLWNPLGNIFKISQQSNIPGHTLKKRPFKRISHESIEIFYPNWAKIIYIMTLESFQFASTWLLRHFKCINVLDNEFKNLKSSKRIQRNSWINSGRKYMIWIKNLIKVLEISKKGLSSLFFSHYWN